MAGTTTMTERRSAALWVVTAAGAVFAVVLIFLALQMRAGGDPALGAGTPVAAAPPPKPRPVLIRKVIVRRVIEEEPAAPAAAAPAAAAGHGAGRRRAGRVGARPGGRGARARSGPGARAGARHDGGVMILRLRVDETFRAMGTDVRLLVSAPDAPLLAAAARELIEDFEATCSRFRPGSELCALNADPRRVVPASRTLRDAVRAALWAAERSGGLVDPCLLGALEAAGYDRSFTPPAAAVPPPAGSGAPAAPAPAAAWRAVAVDDAAGTIARPPGLRLDLGGSGKGHVADRVAALLAPADRWVADCGGDVRLGGAHDVEVAHPLGGPPAARLTVADAAVATSSVARRAWRTGRGAAHHLLDPATGRPAWAGVLAATAIAPTALEAETLAKVAVLAGDPGALEHGGLLVRAGGAIEHVGPAGRPARRSVVDGEEVAA